ncbi:hypothetical protein ACWCQQ_50980, partial [Streptomyces sp. NPDC002143]
MVARIEHLVTSGTFSLDGGTWDVENNVWIVGDDEEADDLLISRGVLWREETVVPYGRMQLV